MENTLKYSVIAPKLPGSLVTFEYNLEGRLIGIAFNDDASISFKDKVGQNLPHRQSELFHMDVYKGCEVSALNEVNLTFSNFWTCYNYKVGNKARVMKKWEELPNGDKIQALGFIRRYHNWCDRKKIEYCYPETYLNQRRWENHID